MTLIQKCCHDTLPDVLKRIEEVFARGADGAVNDAELMNWYYVYYVIVQYQYYIFIYVVLIKSDLTDLKLY